MIAVKIGGDFRRRLAEGKADRTVRVAVMLTAASPAGRGQDRREAVRLVREAARSAKAALDPLLLRLGGRWLAEEPDALGSLGVEASPAAILAFADSAHVKAILEDQRVTPVHARRPATNALTSNRATDPKGSTE